MSCNYCDFNQPEKVWEIELYESTSYKYEGKKYFLEITYPADGRYYHKVRPVEIKYCPMCGRKLGAECVTSSESKAAVDDTETSLD